MNNPNDNKSADGNYGKKIASVALGKKKDLAKKMNKSKPKFRDSMMDSIEDHKRGMDEHGIR